MTGHPSTQLPFTRVWALCSWCQPFFSIQQYQCFPPRSTGQEVFSVWIPLDWRRGERQMNRRASRSLLPRPCCRVVWFQSCPDGVLIYTSINRTQRSAMLSAGRTPLGAPRSQPGVDKLGAWSHIVFDCPVSPRRVTVTERQKLSTAHFTWLLSAINTMLFRQPPNHAETIAVELTTFDIHIGAFYFHAIPPISWRDYSR